MIDVRKRAATGEPTGGVSRRQALRALLMGAGAVAVSGPVLALNSPSAQAVPPAAQDADSTEWPTLMSSARGIDGRDYAVGWHPDAGVLWQSVLPARAHGPAISPDRRVGAFPGRRPGSYVHLLDPEDGRTLAQWQAPADRSFQGHAAFTADGRMLFTTEVRYDDSYADGESGVLGIWDVASGKRLGEIASHGIEPHEIRLMADGRTLVVANGGILTSPDTRRAKLNIGAMDTSLVYIDAAGGTLLEKAAPPDALRRLSLRHLAETRDGAVLIAAQYQGNPADKVPLMAVHRRGASLDWLTVTPEETRALRQYCGSIGATDDGRYVVTSPVGGLALSGREGETDALRLDRPDVCGLAIAGDRVLLTTGFGDVLRLSVDGTLHQLAREAIQWDNHAVFA